MAAAFQRRGSPDKPFRDLVEGDLKPRRYRSCYVLVGEDPFRIESVVEHLRDDVLGPQGAAFNYHVRHGDQADMLEVLRLANSFPMLGSRQLIWLKEAERSLAGSATAETAFLKYLASPVDATILVLSAGKLDGRKKWVKECRASGCTFDCSAPKGAELRDWVRRASRKADMDLGEEMLDLLIDHVGEDLHALQSEIQKLSLICGDGADPVSSAEAAEIVLRQRYEGPFELVAGLRPGDPTAALTMWHQLRIWGHHAEEIAPLLAWRIRKMSLLVSLDEAGISSPQEMAEHAGMQHWVASKLLPTARAFGRDGLRRALEACRRCDAALKGSPMRSDMALERAIIEICA